MQEMMFFYLFPGVFTLLGVVFLAIGIGMTVNENRKKRVCTQSCTAKIVDVVRESSRSADDSYTVSWHPVYEYRANGRTLRRKSSIGSGRNHFTIGETRTLFINPDRPEEYLCPEEKRGLLQGIFTGIGCVLLVIGIAVFVIMVR